jgi:hypothetical protein
MNTLQVLLLVQTLLGKGFLLLRLPQFIPRTILRESTLIASSTLQSLDQFDFTKDNVRHELFDLLQRELSHPISPTLNPSELFDSSKNLNIFVTKLIGSYSQNHRLIKCDEICSMLKNYVNITQNYSLYDVLNLDCGTFTALMTAYIK